MKKDVVNEWMIQFGPQIKRKINAGTKMISPHCVGRQSCNIDFDCGDTFIICVAYNKKKQILLNKFHQKFHSYEKF